MHDAYCRIFTRLGLRFRAVTADTGPIGGSGSHEFHVLADSGEDAIAFCPDSDYAANIEMAESLQPVKSRGICWRIDAESRNKVKKTCEEVAAALNVPVEQTVKTLAVVADGKCIYCCYAAIIISMRLKLAKFLSFPISGWLAKKKFAQKPVVFPVI